MFSTFATHFPEYVGLFYNVFKHFLLKNCLNAFFELALE